MRLVIFATACLASLAVLNSARCETSEPIKLSAREIGNVWKYCSVSGRATAAILECFRQQTDKLGQAKEIQRNNQRMEALTRQQVGVPPQPAR